MRKKNATNGIRRLEQASPPPARLVIRDPEFARDVAALIGRIADVGQQHRPIQIDRVMDGVVISYRGAVHAMLTLSDALVIGHIDGGPIHDTRAKHGAAWQAVNGLLERHDIDAAISDRESVNQGRSTGGSGMNCDNGSNQGWTNVYRQDANQQWADRVNSR